jgi:hypothetical protein
MYNFYHKAKRHKAKRQLKCNNYHGWNKVSVAPIILATLNQHPEEAEKQHLLKKFQSSMEITRIRRLGNRWHCCNRADANHHHPRVLKKNTASRVREALGMALFTASGNGDAIRFPSAKFWGWQHWCPQLQWQPPLQRWANDFAGFEKTFADQQTTTTKSAASATTSAGGYRELEH